MRSPANVSPTTGFNIPTWIAVLSGQQTISRGRQLALCRKVEVDNLQRAIWWNDDWYVSPWGFLLNKEAYYGFSAYGLWPAAVAYARHGAFNQYVASYYYQTTIHHLYSYYPGILAQKTENLSGNIYMYDHHDGGLDYRQVHAVLMKYMYPDDPLVDYVYGPYAVSIEQRSMALFITALFGLDPGVNGKPASLPEMAKAKALPLTKVDPQIGVVVARSGWKEDDMMLIPMPAGPIPATCMRKRTRLHFSPWAGLGPSRPGTIRN